MWSPERHFVVAESHFDGHCDSSRYDLGDCRTNKTDFSRTVMIGRLMAETEAEQLLPFATRLLW